MTQQHRGRALTCADLFSGAGGFSEGFRQAGFRVTKALDLWAPAVVTHEKNHPDTQAIRGDILAFRPEDLGPVDVLIGSPPCTEFSFANRGGNGDIEAGLRLVHRFLRFVYELEPRWWVMENVPRTLDFLPPEVPLRTLGIDKKGALEIPVRTILVSSDFGTPQKRARAFSGNFPLPITTHAEFPREGQRPWRTLGHVVQTLADPLHPLPLGSTVVDPVYGFELAAHDLTDHFSDRLELTDEEERENRKAKEDHSWYGRMSFPDDLDRPGRTVMATNLRVSRETTVIPSSTGRFRRLSVREASSVQGFPITYQWWGNSEGLKYKLVGNAVAPPVSFAVAGAIARAASREVPSVPHVIRSVNEPAPEIALSRKAARKLPLTRRFREHIPGSKVPGFRVDLDNEGQGPTANPGWKVGRRLAPHPVRWRTVLYRGSGKALREHEVSLKEALRRLALTVADVRSEERVREFVADLQAKLPAVVPDASTLQGIRAERLTREVTPFVLLELIGESVRRSYGSTQTVIRLSSRRTPDSVPATIAATLLATAYVCELANQSGLWLSIHREAAFPPMEGTVPSDPAKASLNLGLALEKQFQAALRKYGPRTEREREARAEIEQLTITGA